MSPGSLITRTHRSRERLAWLDYDFEALRTFMLGRDLTTVDLVFEAGERLYHARNPFPVGGVYEDPATGAAAAAFGAYLRELGRVAVPAQVASRQQWQATRADGRARLSFPRWCSPPRGEKRGDR
jgi:predicted PhzF superfamily epimerase YddE/YHI9